MSHNDCDDWAAWAEAVIEGEPPLEDEDTLLRYASASTTAEILNEAYEEGYSENLEDHELEFVKGYRAEFDRLIGLFLMTEIPTKPLPNEASLGVSASDGERYKAKPFFHEFTSHRIEKLVELALKYHEPYGWEWYYNDETYRKSPAVIQYSLEEYQARPARERMDARLKLREWLISIGENPAEFGLDEWEKIK